MFNFADKFYGRSPKWRKVRGEHIKRNPTCAACGRKEGLEVHHVIPYHVDNTKELDPNNLITLCGKYCHFVFGHFMDWKSWNENVVRDTTLYHISKKARPYREVFGGKSKECPYAIYHTMCNFVTWLFKFFRKSGND